MHARYFARQGFCAGDRRSELPAHLAFSTCPYCSDIARLNILIFGDWKWIDPRKEQQRERLDAWLGKVHRVLTIEIGAGKHIPMVQHFREFQPGPLIRISLTKPIDAKGQRC